MLSIINNLELNEKYKEKLLENLKLLNFNFRFLKKVKRTALHSLCKKVFNFS